MKFILGTKLNMTQIWRDDRQVAVTKVKAGPCVVTQVKTVASDGYAAVQLGFGQKKRKNIKKPQLGHLKKLGDFRYLKEFRAEVASIKTGDQVALNSFVAGEIIKVSGASKGKGFQGVVKRYGFAGASKTHGTKDQVRMPGSSGATEPAHVFKGTRKPGRMGGKQVTVANLEIVEVDEKDGVILIKGAVPGARNGLVIIKGQGELKIQAAEMAFSAGEGEVKDKEKNQESAPQEKAEEKSDKNEKKADTVEKVEKMVVEADKQREDKEEKKGQV